MAPSPACEPCSNILRKPGVWADLGTKSGIQYRRKTSSMLETASSGCPICLVLLNADRDGAISERPKAQFLDPKMHFRFRSGSQASGLALEALTRDKLSLKRTRTAVFHLRAVGRTSSGSLRYR